MGQDQDDMIIAPYTTIQKRLLAITYIQGIFASAVTEDDSEEAIEEISAILRQNHKIAAGDEDDFHVRSQEELSSMMSTTTDLMTVLLACIAGISLLVGGIGIMNIMYVSVTERTREIGIRMAVGARASDVLQQFLIEAVLVCLVGGALGVALSLMIAFILQLFLPGWEIGFSPLALLTAFLCSTLTGVLFGWLPARNAARLDPVDALARE